MFSCLAGMITTAQTPNWFWAKSATGASQDFAKSVATDATGNVYVTGTFASTNFNLGAVSLTNAGGPAVYIAKYDASGNVLWAKRAGGYGDATCVAADASGNVYITGDFFSGPLTFGTTTLTNAGSNDIFLAKYDASGNVVWAKSVGGPSQDYSRGLATDLTGNVYITGYFLSPSLVFGTDTLKHITGADVFVAKYNASGNAVWARGAKKTSGDPAVSNSVATDASGNVFMTGYFQSPRLIFGTDTLTNTIPGGGNNNIFLTKYNALGNLVWAKSAGGISTSVSTDVNGNAFIIGSLSFTSVVNAFLAKYDASGNMAWAASAIGASPQGVATDANGNVLITGYFGSANSTFGTITLTSAGSSDIFLAKYDATGNAVWAKSAGGTDSDKAYGVSTNASGDVFVAGDFLSPAISFGSIILTNTANQTGGINDIFVAKVSATTGIAENLIKNHISIYPNPFSTTATLKINSATSFKNAELKIYDVLGREVKHILVNTSEIIINRDELENGIYFYKLMNSQEVIVTGKIIIE